MLALEFERAVAPRQHHRDRDDPCEDTPEIPDDEIQSGPEQQERPITYLTVGQPCRHLPARRASSANVKTASSSPLIRQEYVGAIVPLLRGPMMQQID